MRWLRRRLESERAPLIRPHHRKINQTFETSRVAASPFPRRKGASASSNESRRAWRPTTGDDAVTADAQSASDVHQKILPVLAASPPRRLPSALWRGDLCHAGERRSKRATKARVSTAIEKAGAASRVRALTGEERNSSRFHCTRDGHRFESPQLHQEVRARFSSSEPCRRTVPFSSAFLLGVIGAVTLLQYLPWPLWARSPNFLLQQGTLF
jgi:hypothetical protein